MIYFLQLIMAGMNTVSHLLMFKKTSIKLVEFIIINLELV